MEEFNDWRSIQSKLIEEYNSGIHGRNVPRICPKCGRIMKCRFISHILSCGVDQRWYVKQMTGDSGICNVCGTEKPITGNYYFKEYCSDSCARSDSRSRWTYEDHPYKTKEEVDEHNLRFVGRDYSGLDYGRDLVNKRRSNGDEKLLSVSRANIARAHMANSYEHCEEFGITKDQLYNKLISRDMSIQIKAMHDAQVKNGFYSSEAQSYHASCIKPESRVKAGLASVAARFDGRLGKKSLFLGFEMASTCELLGTILFSLENKSYKLIEVHKELINTKNDLGSSYTDSVFLSPSGSKINVEIHDSTDIDVVAKKKFCSEINNYSFVLIDTNLHNLISKIHDLGYDARGIVDYVSEYNRNKLLPIINLDDWKLTS